MNSKALCFCLFVFLISCTSKQSQQENLLLEGEHYVIDLNGKKETSLPISYLFKNIKTIILETGEDCMIGNINELQVFEGNIYILDSSKAKKLFVFDWEGRFIRKIGNIGNGPGEYLEPIDFTLDTKNRIIYLRDLKNRIHKYRLNGTFINTITIDAPNSAAMFIQYHNEKLYLSQQWWEKSDDNYMLLEVDPNDGKILSRSLPVKYNKGWNELYFSAHSRFFMSRANNPPRYNQMFMDYIVSIGEEITPYIELKSKNLTTKTDIEGFQDAKKDRLPFINISRSSKIFNVHSFIENDDFICFRCGMNYLTSFAAIFYKETGEVKLAKYLYNDLIYRQDLKEGRERIEFGKFMFADEKGAYEIFDTQGYNVLDKFQYALKNNEIVPDLDKLDQLMKLTAESNPVVFFYEFK